MLGCNYAMGPQELYRGQWEVTVGKVLALPQGSSLAGPPCEVIPATGKERVRQGAPPVPDKLSNAAPNYSLLTEASSHAAGRAWG